MMVIRVPSLLLLTLAAGGVWSGDANGAMSPTCNQWATFTCKSTNPDWKTDGTTACSALHGGYKGNAQNLQHLMINHFKDSFKLMLAVSNKQEFSL